MGLSDVARLTSRAPAATPSRLLSAVVVRSDASGVWAAPLGADRRAPLGPCRGAWRWRATTAPAGGDSHAHQLIRERLPVGAAVLLSHDGGDRPWIAATDQED